MTLPPWAVPRAKRREAQGWASRMKGYTMGKTEQIVREAVRQALCAGFGEAQIAIWVQEETINAVDYIIEEKELTTPCQ